MIPEYELTLPATTRGQLTTVEGLIRDVVSDLSMDQPLRRIQDEDGYTKIQALIDRLWEILDEDEDEEAHVKITAEKDNKPFPPFTIKLDDPAGNSWIEFIGSMADPKWNVRTYPRTQQHNVALGLVAAEDQQQVQASSAELPSESRQVSNPDPITADEVFVFPGHCSSCGHPLDTLMKKVNIPYFKVSCSVSIFIYGSQINSRMHRIS
jgi:zinc finger protein